MSSPRTVPGGARPVQHSRAEYVRLLDTLREDAAELVREAEA